ncbi:MAG: binding-protein-dependent transport system inner rane component [Mucilaginibacter sp.]|nr:binding-protein-dependent transport system inner rane component [Mucilaginibacter sp.]
MRKNIYRYSPGLVIVATLFIGWFAIAYFSNVREIFFPKPEKVLVTLFALTKTSEFWQDTLASSLRVTAAFLISFLVSYPVVLLALTNNFVKKLVFTIVEFFRYLPIPVFIPLTILWFGIDDTGKIFIVFLGTFAQMIPMFYDSTLILKESYTSFPAALKWKKKQIIRYIIVPGSAPYIWDNCRICLGWAWTYLIIAELMGADHGLGFAIIRAQRYLATDRIFAYVIMIGMIGLLSDRLMTFLKRKLFNW